MYRTEAKTTAICGGGSMMDTIVLDQRFNISFILLVSNGCMNQRWHK